MHGGSQYSEVLKASGTPPNCNCVVDVRDKGGRLTKTIKVEKGDKITTFEFDPDTGTLKSKETISLQEEREKIREKLGFKYNEEQIDKLLDPKKMDKWFTEQLKDIETDTRLYTPEAQVCPATNTSGEWIWKG